MTNLDTKKPFLVESIQMCHQSTFLIVCVRFNETWHQLRAGVCLPSPAQPCWSSFTLMSLGGSKEPVVGLFVEQRKMLRLSSATSEAKMIQVSPQLTRWLPGMKGDSVSITYSFGDRLKASPHPAELAPVLGSVWGLNHRSPMTHVSTETLNRTK